MLWSSGRKQQFQATVENARFIDFFEFHQRDSWAIEVDFENMVIPETNFVWSIHMAARGARYFLTQRSDFVQALMQSKTQQGVIGLWTKGSQAEMTLCIVTDIMDDDDENDMLVLIRTIGAGTYSQDEAIYVHEIERMYLFDLAASVDSLKLLRPL